MMNIEALSLSQLTSNI